MGVYTIDCGVGLLAVRHHHVMQNGTRGSSTSHDRRPKLPDMSDDLHCPSLQSSRWICGTAADIILTCIRIRKPFFFDLLISGPTHPPIFSYLQAKSHLHILEDLMVELHHTACITISL
jgi:hypothetical protein